MKSLNFPTILENRAWSDTGQKSPRHEISTEREIPIRERAGKWQLCPQLGTWSLGLVRSSDVMTTAPLNLSPSLCHLYTDLWRDWRMLTSCDASTLKVTCHCIGPQANMNLQGALTFSRWGKAPPRRGGQARFGDCDFMSGGSFVTFVKLGNETRVICLRLTTVHCVGWWVSVKC